MNRRRDSATVQVWKKSRNAAAPNDSSVETIATVGSILRQPIYGIELANYLGYNVIKMI